MTTRWDRPVERSWCPPYRPQLRATLGVLRRGGGDPTWYDEPGGAVWKTWRMPTGAVTVRLDVDAGSARVRATAWGPGAARLAEELPRMLGGDDDPAGFTAQHAPVAAALHAFPGWRMPRTGLVVDALVPAVIEQKVTGAEAFAGYRMLVRRYGEPAPGPGAGHRLVVAPDAATWAAIPSWEWLAAGVDAQRSRTAVAAVRRADRLEECTELPSERARARMQGLPGVGGWTAAEVAQRALGDSDAVSFGDYHVARDIGWALTGCEVDDDGLAELLAPYAPHRYRVQRLLELAGTRRPRHGPRLAPRAHLPVRRSGPRRG